MLQSSDMKTSRQDATQIRCRYSLQWPGNDPARVQVFDEAFVSNQMICVLRIDIDCGPIACGTSPGVAVPECGILLW